jgi:hypothetical protein
MQSNYKDSTTQPAFHLRRNERANLRILRETNSPKELGLSAANLPLPAKRIRIVKDCFTITCKHLSHFEITHEANAVSKMRALALSDQNGNKVFVSLDIKILALAQIQNKNMLMVAGLPMRDRETRDCIRHGCVSHTIQVVNALARHFKNICTNSERGTGNVRNVMSGSVSGCGCPASEPTQTLHFGAPRDHTRRGSQSYAQAKS